MKLSEKKQLAAELLEITLDELEENSAHLDDIGALYVSVPTKDGCSILIADDGSVLFGNSAISFTQLIAEFNRGKRTPKSFFKN